MTSRQVDVDQGELRGVGPTKRHQRDSAPRTRGVHRRLVQHLRRRVVLRDRELPRFRGKNDRRLRLEGVQLDLRTPQPQRRRLTEHRLLARDFPRGRLQLDGPDERGPIEDHSLPDDNRAQAPESLELGLLQIQNCADLRARQIQTVADPCPPQHQPISEDRVGERDIRRVDVAEPGRARECRPGEVRGSLKLRLAETRTPRKRGLGEEGRVLKCDLLELSLRQELGAQKGRFAAEPGLGEVRVPLEDSAIELRSTEVRPIVGYGVQQLVQQLLGESRTTDVDVRTRLKTGQVGAPAVVV